MVSGTSIGPHNCCVKTAKRCRLYEICELTNVGDRHHRDIDATAAALVRRPMLMSGVPLPHIFDSCLTSPACCIIGVRCKQRSFCLRAVTTDVPASIWSPAKPAESRTFAAREAIGKATDAVIAAACWSAQVFVRLPCCCCCCCCDETWLQAVVAPVSDGYFEVY